MAFELGRSLLLTEAIPRAALAEALHAAATEGVPLPRALIALGLLEPARLEVELARSDAPLLRTVTPVKELVDALPHGICSRLLAVPVRKDPMTGTVDVAVADPRDPHPAREIGFLLRMPVRVVRAPLEALEAALDRSTKLATHMQALAPPLASRPSSPRTAASPGSPRVAIADRPSAPRIPSFARLPSAKPAETRDPAAASDVGLEHVEGPKSETPAYGAFDTPHVPAVTPATPKPSPSAMPIPLLRGDRSLRHDSEPVPLTRRHNAAPAPVAVDGTRASAVSRVTRVHSATASLERTPSMPPVVPRPPRTPRIGYAGELLTPPPPSAASETPAPSTTPEVSRGARARPPPLRVPPSAASTPALPSPPPILPSPSNALLRGWSEDLPSVLQQPAPIPSTASPPTAAPRVSRIPTLVPPDLPRPTLPSPTLTSRSSFPTLPFEDPTKTVAALRTGSDRDAILMLLLRGVRAVARKVALFVARQGEFVGWACTPEFGSEERLRALRIPSELPSALRAASGGGTHLGPLPPLAAHGGILGVMGRASSDVAVTPVFVAGKVALVILADELGDTLLATERMDRLAKAAAEGLEKLLRRTR